MEGVLKGYVVGYRGAAEALLARISELESRDYPTALSRRLLHVLKGAIRASSRIVEELAAEGDDSVESIIIRHGHLLLWVHQLVHLVSNSIGSDVPRWAIQPMKYEVAKYIKSSADIMIVGSNAGGNFAYDYGLDRLKDVLEMALGKETAAALAGELPQHMAVFHFPFGERDNVLAHGAFFHEVGHQIDIGIRGISHRVAERFLVAVDAELRDAIQHVAAPWLKQLFSTTTLTKSEDSQRTLEDEQAEVLIEGMVKGVQGVLWNWAREFCADLIATRILGPAYAMIVVISPALLSNLLLHAPSHPGTLLRLKAVLNLLSDARVGDFFTECDEELQKAGIRELLLEWRSRCMKESSAHFKWSGAIAPAAPEGIRSLTAAFAERLSTEILDAVVEETNDQGYYTPARYSKDILEVLPILRSWVTINERIDYGAREHEINEVATIFNVGVACFLQQDSAEDRERLSRLLRKSIELSQIQRVINPEGGNDSSLIKADSGPALSS